MAMEIKKPMEMEDDEREIERKFATVKKELEEAMEWASGKEGEKLILSEEERMRAEVYAVYALVEKLSEFLENGFIDVAEYKKMVSRFTRHAILIKGKMKEKGYDLERFINEMNMKERFPVAYEKLRLHEATASVSTISKRITMNPLRVAALTSDITTDLITMMDLLKLKSLARVDMLHQLLAHAMETMLGLGIYDENDDMIKEMKEWIKRLSEKPADMVLGAQEIAELLRRVNVWFSSFNARLKKE